MLLERFSYTVRAQFFGHTHHDHFFVYHAGQRVTGMALVSPSLTTYSDKIPQYRVMTVDQDTMQVLDYTQYNFDLRQAQPQFAPFYSFV